jgi:hypothetical protein
MAIAGCVIMGLFSLFQLPDASFATEQKAAAGKKAMIERGLYLVTVGGCNDCHSPKKMTPNGPAPDEARLLSGHQANEKLPEVPPNIFGPDKWGAITNNNLTSWVVPGAQAIVPIFHRIRKPGQGPGTKSCSSGYCAPASSWELGVTSCLPCPGIAMPNLRTRT